MKIKAAIVLSALALVSLACEAKEYLGFDLGNETFDGVEAKLKAQKLNYEVLYQHDSTGNDIKDLPIIKIKNNPSWEKYGKVDTGEFHFTGGKLYGIYAGWLDKGDSLVDNFKDTIKVFTRQEKETSLFKSLDKAFRKKYTLISAPDAQQSVTAGEYSDDEKVGIILKRNQIYRDGNPMNSYYVTSVSYLDKELDKVNAERLKKANKLAAEDSIKHDPDVQFAHDL